MADALFDDEELGDLVPAWKQLQKIAPPPSFVSAATLEQWQELESLLGLPFPVDFKQLVDTYGNGCFAGFLWICDPFYQWKRPQVQDDYIVWANRRLAALTAGQQAFPEYAAPFPVYPCAEGLLPWGFTDNGDTLCWQTTEPSDHWLLVILDNKQSERYDRYNMTVTEFLVEWLRREIEPKNFPDNIFPSEEPLFRPLNNE